MRVGVVLSLSPSWCVLINSACMSLPADRVVRWVIDEEEVCDDLYILSQMHADEDFRLIISMRMFVISSYILAQVE